MGNDFEFEAYRKETDLLIVLRGRLVLNQCQDLKARLSTLFTPEVDQAYLHLGDLSFLDSAGLGVLVGMKMQANRNHASLVFLSPPRRIEDIFRVSKLDSIFEIRSGAEAEVLYASLGREPYCVWSNRKDSPQSRNATEYNTRHDGPLPRLTSTGGSLESPLDQTEERVRRCCKDAMEYIRQGEHDKAIEQYRLALEIDPDNLAALNNLGIVYEKRPDWYRDSLATWKRVLSLSEHQQDLKHRQRAEKHIATLNKLMGN